LNRKYPLLTFFLLLLLASNVAALSNLKINWVQYSVDSQRIVAEVENDSAQRAEGFTVDFFVDGQMFSSYARGESMELGPNSIIQAFAEFPVDEEDHEFYAVVDPRNVIKESNEEDNAMLEKTSFGDLKTIQLKQEEEVVVLVPLVVFIILSILALFVVIFIMIRKVWRMGRD